MSKEQHITLASRDLRVTASGSAEAIRGVRRPNIAAVVAAANEGDRILEKYEAGWPIESLCALTGRKKKMTRCYAILAQARKRTPNVFMAHVEEGVKKAAATISRNRRKSAIPRRPKRMHASK